MSEVLRKKAMTKCTPEEAREIGERADIDWPIGEEGIARLIDLAREPMAARLRKIEAAAVAADELKLRLRATSWMPISTAPKDGTRILIYEREVSGACDGGVSEVYWDNNVDAWHLCTCTDITDEWITHWMPLPGPPMEPSVGGLDSAIPC